jgi:SulP family sulfate permease
MDASALLSFAKLRDLAQAQQITVVLTGLAPQMQRHLLRACYADAQDTAIRLYADLDQGAEWCEEQILAAAHADAIAQHPLVEQLAAGPAGCSAAARLLCYLARLQIAPGEYLIRQGAPSDALYLVEAGQVTVVLERAGGGPLRLRTMGAGTIVGELGFYLGAPRSASVVAQQTCVVYRLSRSALQEMTTQEPTVATAFHELVARLLAERVVNANASVVALLQSPG